MRRFLSALVAAVAIAAFPGLPAQAVAPTAHQPVLFVHGYNSNASTWNAMLAAFRDIGYTDGELFAISYNYNQSNVTTAQALQTKVEEIRQQTGWASVDIISHSMGSLSSRYYLKNLGGQNVVDAWVSLAGANHGTSTARFCSAVSCREMRAKSSFLAELNAGDETPGPVRYRTWWSPCDSTINPDSSVSLTGATNTKTACLGHSALLSDPTVFGQVELFVDP
ncbi:MAG: triacylglycerol lipase [Actinomycetota bacterium]|nr:triacylglycerol lipase [Actinomycetota bacterium]